METWTKEEADAWCAQQRTADPAGAAIGGYVAARMCEAGARLDGDADEDCPRAATCERTVGGLVWPLCAECAAEIDAEAAEITDEQIRALRAEAGAAGDAAQVAICNRALDGSDAARMTCARVIRDAEAQS